MFQKCYPLLIFPKIFGGVPLLFMVCFIKTPTFLLVFVKLLRVVPCKRAE